MDRLIYTAMTGASQTLNMQMAVAHNLANVNTVGYRAEEHRLRAVQLQSNAQPQGLPTRAFVVEASTHTNMTPGPLMITGKPLDIAVRGAGWIAVQLPDGSEAYTRAGAFEISVNGVVQTRGGLTVLGDGGAISIPPEVALSVGVDGTITTLPESGARKAASSIGRFKLVNPQETDLVRGADGMFRLRDGSAASADESVRLVAGSVEGSNVNPAEQMVNMISLSRLFDMQMKVLSTADANDQAASQILASR